MTDRHTTAEQHGWYGSASHSLSSQPSPNPLSAHNVASVLRTKRKPPHQKVCQPCRLRKVKCTYDTPCETCVKRGHPELCHYESIPSKRVHLDSTAQDSSGEASAVDSLKQELLDIRLQLGSIHNLLRSMRDDMNKLRTSGPLQNRGSSNYVAPASVEAAESVEDATVVQGISTSDDRTGAAIYIGGNSVPAMVVALANSGDSDSAVQDVLGKSILPVFCLDNESATYPFVDLWGIPHGSFKRIELLCKLLPTTDSECMHVFKQYRDTAHVIYPGIIDIVQFESDILDFLRQRRNINLDVQPGPLTSQLVYGRDLHWLGLLFAAFASGAQCSELPRRERQMKSQVYGMIFIVKCFRT
jgi:hypothetical protein